MQTFTRILKYLCLVSVNFGPFNQNSIEKHVSIYIIIIFIAQPCITFNHKTLDENSKMFICTQKFLFLLL